MDKKLVPKIMNLLLDTVCVVNAQGSFIYVSASCEDLLGYTPEELVGKNIADLVHPDDLQRTLAMAMEVKSGQSALHFENRYIHKDGHSVDIMWSARWSKADNIRLAVARNMTNMKQAERLQAAIYRISEAGQTTEDLPTLCEHIHEIINDLLPVQNFSVVLFDRKKNTISIPYCVGEAAYVGKEFPADHSHVLSPDSPITQIVLSGEPVLTTVQMTSDSDRQDKTRQWLGVPLLAGRKVMGALVIQGGVNIPVFTQKDQELLQFISTQIAAAIQRKQAETHLRHMAGHDPLTDLPNRSLFQDRVEVALNRAQREKEHLALLYLDLDDFKQVNDQFGHEVGDQLLIEVANRLTGCLRKSDTAARMGGDEFTILLVNIQSPNCLSCVIKKISKALAQPFEILNHSLNISASIGSAFYPDSGLEYGQLLRHADQRMYSDKQRRKLAPIESN